MRFWTGRCFKGLSGAQWAAATFGRCYQIAIIYPALLILAAWAVADVRDFGGAQLGFTTTTTWWGRLGRTGVVLMASALANYAFSIDENHPPRRLQK